MDYSNGSHFVLYFSVCAIKNLYKPNIIICTWKEDKESHFLNFEISFGIPFGGENMKHRSILLLIMVLACLAAQAYAQPASDTMGSSEDYISPNFGQLADNTNPDEGLAGMLQWLDQPVNSFPWYSSSSRTFYSQAYSDSIFSPFSEFYITSGMPVVGGIISNPAKFDITSKNPRVIYYGTGQALPYTQYTSTLPSKTNDLWIQGATSWSQYVVSPVGTWLQLVANVPVGGPGGFYEIVQTDTNTVKYNTYQFYQGYNTMNINVGQVGRHMLYFVVNNQPSNVVIVDVFAQTSPGYSGSTPSYGGSTPYQQSPSYQPSSSGQSGYPSSGGY